MNLDLYDRKFFDWHTPLKPHYAVVTSWLKANIFPDCDERLTRYSVLDLGCGNGYLLEAFGPRYRIMGVEAALAALEFMAPAVRNCAFMHDLTQPGVAVGRYDLVICTEVAEHLPPESEDTLLRTIFNCSKKWLYFSAATPGQGGEGHLNEQTHEYWINRFRALGYRYDEALTRSLRSVVGSELSWLRDNSMIFEATWR